MNGLLLFLVVLVIAKMMLQMDLYSTRGSIAIALLYALVPIVVHQTALTVNRMAVETYLSTPESLLNVSLVVMIDLLLSVYACLYATKPLRGGRLKRITMVVLRSLPSLSVIPAIAYLQFHLFFLAISIPFFSQSLLLSVVVFCLFVVAKPGIGLIMGRNSSRLRVELVVLLSFFIFVYTVAMGLIRSEGHVGQKPDDSILDPVTTGGAALLIVSIVSLGYLFRFAHDRFVGRKQKL